jgi:DNA polymerase bacteriophage-type
MALALSHGYPGSLEGAAAMLGLANQKDAKAAKKVRVMWQPRKPRRGEDPNVLYWVDTPELRAKLYAYCKQDVVAERELHHRLSALPAEEQEAWVIDAEINERGVLIDAPLAQAASHLVVKALRELDTLINEKTNGAVDTASKTQKLKAWLVAQGLKLPSKSKKNEDEELEWHDSLDAEDIEKLLAGAPPNECVREVLEIRLKAAQSAVSKIDRMLVTRCADGRVRNLYRMYGTRTGRWSGEGFQPQNLKRPEILKGDADIAAAIEMVRAEDYAAIKEKHGDVLGVIGDLCRSMLIPAPGHRFIVGDFSAIEARVLTWLAGDEKKLETFLKFDRGEGRDIYCIAAEQVLGLDHEADSQERGLGKQFELGLGYTMGPARLLTGIQRSGHPRASPITIQDTTRWVKRWREQNPKIVKFWKALDSAAMAATQRPGIIMRCGAVSFEMWGDVLSLRLPSGRELKYPNPVIEPSRLGYPQIRLDGHRSERMYGGKWAENVTSAAARDLLVEAMKRLRAAGYVLTLHTHDEIGAEMPVESGSAGEFKRLLIEVPAWAHGLPIAAKVFECDRFKKD